nr:MAG TPA: PAR1 protein [Caudoviricetes sp.]
MLPLYVYFLQFFLTNPRFFRKLCTPPCFHTLF